MLALHKKTNGPYDDQTCTECGVDENTYPEWPCSIVQEAHDTCRAEECEANDRAQCPMAGEFV